MFTHLELYGGDPIFRLNEQYQADARQPKVNLTIGLYCDGNGRVPLLPSVLSAEQLCAQRKQPRTYLPMEGLATYNDAVQRLVFGEDCPALAEGRVASIQTLGGTGALKIGGDFLHLAYPDAEMWISDPAWDNHHAIFQGARVPTHSYRYYDAATRGLDFEGLVADLSALPRHSIVLLHPCCHNPTGVDLTPAQWDQVIDLLQRQQLIPFLDMAYQGFGQGLAEDAYAVRAMARAGLTFLVANSFSKNFSYYAERCGGLHIVCQNAAEAERVLGQLRAAVRRVYSNPPVHGAQAISEVLHSDGLFAQWQAEVSQMRQRIATMRQAVYDQLQTKAPHYDASHFIRQQGMFCYTGLSSEQVTRLREEFAVYLLASGRISVPGLNTENVSYFTDALAEVVR